MPPRYLRRSSPTRLKPCQERMIETCDAVPADQCCGVIPCTICIEWETYSGIEYGTASFGTSSWTGTVGGISFVSYWQRNEAGECEYVVTFGGYEVYRATCYEGASCRNPAGEVETTVGNETGTLRWQVYQSRELQLIDNPDTGCKDFFCSSCRCSCQCVCVTITEYGGDVITGELCDIAYECDAPLWAGPVGYYDLSFALGRDQYGECIVTATVDGEEQDPVSAGGCAAMSATITLANGTVIRIACKQCQCIESICVGCCAEGIPKTLYVSGGILGESTLALNCTDCDLQPCDDATLKTWNGSFVTGWYLAFGYGSGCTILSRYRFRARLNFAWTCGSGFNLSVTAVVEENDPAFDAITLGDNSTQNVSEGCGPLLNIFDNICIGDGWMLTEPAVHCAADPPGTVRCPQTYVVTI